MKLLKALLLLIGATALLVGLLHGIMPKGNARSPADTIDPLPLAGRQRQAADDRSRLNPAATASGIDPAEPPSPLVALIRQAGFSCAHVIGVAPIDAGEGVYAIRCLARSDGEAEAHYRVRTREGRVSRL
jgi:hypothetical protein